MIERFKGYERWEIIFSGKDADRKSAGHSASSPSKEHTESARKPEISSLPPSYFSGHAPS
jgi:hypothetical protein